MRAILSPQRSKAALRPLINLSPCTMVHQPGPRSAAEADALSREAEAVLGPRKRKVQPSSYLRTQALYALLHRHP